MNASTLGEVEAARIWDEFCDTLKQAKAVLFRDGAPATAQDRAAGLRMLSRHIPIALDKMFENADPLHPAFIHHNDWRHKFAGDNPDCLYLWAPINGTDTYRISGTWGSAAYVVFTVNDFVNTVTGGKPFANLGEVAVEDDGTFEIIASPQEPSPRPRNWLRTSPNSFRIMLRQFFGDWENEEKINLRIDRLGETPPPEVTADGVRRGLSASAQQVVDMTAYWAQVIALWQSQPMQFLPFHEVTQGKVAAATPGGAPLTCYWTLAADEAIVIRVVPPRAKYWNMEIGNWWFESMDYRYRLSGTNSHYATLEENGELIAVISHDDPGVPNWFDASGFACGYALCRWMKADAAPVPTVERVKRSELRAHLPGNVRTIDAAARRVQIAARNRGMMKRFAGF
ncbi:MAG: DUF1214 domain-containing protein [Gammaproteobacteria bacterium]